MSTPLLDQIRFLRHCVGGRHARALACLPQHAWQTSGRALWAAHRLGLHALVADAAWNGKHRPAGLAKAISLAAIGRREATVDQVERLRHRFAPDEVDPVLAQALASWMPELARTLAEHPQTPWALRCALQLRTGDREAAAHQLHAVERAGRVDASWHLLAANALASTPDQLLAHLNAVLGHASLMPLVLRDADRPPGTRNLRAAHPSAAIEGPRITVLMTTYQSQDRVGPAIDSLLAQTWRNLEVVVVDDASTDQTVDRIRAIAERDARVRCLALPGNVGTYVAKTIGLAQATGEFITCQDSDDWAHPQKLALQVRPLLRDRHLVATTSKWLRLSDEGQWYARAVHPFLRLNPASPLFRRAEVERATGVWDAVRTGADSEFLARLRLVFGADAVQGLSLPLTFGAHRADSLMTAAATGYSATGHSPVRQAYWEAWTHWHIATLRAGQTPAMPGWPPRTPDTPRPFAVPAGIATA